MSMKLQLKRDEEPEETNACPSCGANMPPSAVICIECGYDTRSGRRSGEEGRKKLSPMILFAIVLGVIGVSVSVVMRSLNSSSELPPPPPSTPATTPATNSTLEPASAPAAPEPEATPAASTNPADETATESTDEESATGPEEPAVPAVDWAAIEAEQLEKATDELDRRAPMYDAGEAIELRLTNGVIVRGTFKGLKNGNVTIEVTSDDVRELPVESLDRQNRVRTEAQYRERYIEFAVKKKIAEMQRAETNAP